MAESIAKSIDDMADILFGISLDEPNPDTAQSDIVNVISKSRVDAQSLSNFMTFPASDEVTRRLSGDINSLEFYLDYLRGLEKVYKQQGGSVTVDGVQVSTLYQAINDALNAQAVIDSVVNDSFVTVTPRAPNMVARAQRSVNAESVSVEDFGASTSKPNNTVEINNALSYALANSLTVEFPNKNYVVTGNLPNLHKVDCRGNGSISRDGNVFYIAPNNEQSNIIYVKPTGTGDGLSKTSACGIPQIIGALKNLQNRASSGNWRVHLCAGTYANDGIRFNDIPAFANQLQFTGDLKFTGEHDTIWSGASSVQAYAMRCDLVCSPQRALVKDIKFTGWKLDPTNAGALVFWGGHQLITENVYCYDMPIGIWTSRNSVHRSQGDKLENCTTWGIGCQYNSSVYVGIPSKRTTFKNCDRALHVGRASICHNDYSDFEDNGNDLYITQNSRITHINPTFKRWTRASHYVQNGAINEAIDVCDFDAASITYATPILLTENAAVIDKVQSKGMELLHQSYVPPLPVAVTGLTEPKELSDVAGFGSWARLPKMLFYQGSAISIRLAMRVQGNNLSSANSISFTAASGLDTKEFIRFDLPQGGWDGRIELCIEFRDGGGCYSYGSLTFDNKTSFKSKTLSKAELEGGFIDKTSNLSLWRSYIRLADSSDLITIASLKSWVTL